MERKIEGSTEELVDIGSRFVSAVVVTPGTETTPGRDRSGPVHLSGNEGWKSRRRRRTTSKSSSQALQLGVPEGRMAVGVSPGPSRSQGTGDLGSRPRRYSSSLHPEFLLEVRTLGQVTLGKPVQGAGDSPD